jgi:hypothetical protein
MPPVGKWVSALSVISERSVACDHSPDGLAMLAQARQNVSVSRKASAASITPGSAR